MRFALRFSAYASTVSLLLCSTTSADAQVTQSALRQMVLNRLQAAPIIADKSEFRISDRCFFYKLGGLKSGSYPSAVDIPVETQFRVELVRSWEWPQRAENILTPYLQQIETHVAAELSLLGEDPDNPLIYNNLVNHRRTTDS